MNDLESQIEEILWRGIGLKHIKDTIPSKVYIEPKSAVKYATQSLLALVKATSEEAENNARIAEVRKTRLMVKRFIDNRLLVKDGLGRRINNALAIRQKKLEGEY